MAPSVLGEHRLIERLGAGGMGEVWSAVHIPTGSQRALKLIRVADPATLLRFQREGEVLARIEGHPNLVRVHAAGHDAGLAWIAMELLPGGDLERRIAARGPLPPEEASRLVRDLALALAHVHRQGVLHRDLKPSNVLFDAEGRPKLVDFGMAWLAGSRSLTGTGEVAGTPSYMAPEQVRADGRVDERVDVYGLGALLYHALTGRPPFKGVSMLATLELVLSGSSSRPRELRPEIPSALEAVCLSALARDPDDRPRTALILARDLDAAWTRRTGPAKRAMGLLACASLIALVGVVGLSRMSPPPEQAAARSQAPPSSGALPRANDATVWSERLSNATRVGRKGIELIELVEMNHAWSRIEDQLARDLAPSHADMELLERGAAQGHPRARLLLALALLRPGAVAAGRAEEQLWLASRSPPSATTLRAAMVLAARLAEPDREPAVARFLLEELARAPLERRRESREALALAACAWARLGGPGDLGRAVDVLRECPRVALQSCPDPVARALLAASCRLGWGRSGEDVPRAEALFVSILAGAEGPVRRVALSFLSLSASLGDPTARRVLGDHPLPRAESFPPSDVLALDGTAVVYRPSEAELEAHLPYMVNTSREADRDLARIRHLAELGFAPSQNDLAGQLHKQAKDPGGRLCWLVRAGIDSKTIQGDVMARARAGRLLLLGRGAEPDPDRAVAWLRSVLERELLTRKEALLVRVWLGIARASGRGLERDTIAGLREMRGALREAPGVDHGSAAWLYDAWEADASGDPWATWTVWIADASALGDPELAQLGEVARSDPRARGLLELLAGEEAAGEPEWRRRAARCLARLLREEGELTRSDELERLAESLAPR